MIIGIDDIYIKEYNELFSEKSGKTYITELLGEILSKKYSKKVLIINLDYNREKCVFSDRNLKYDNVSTLNDFIGHFNYAIKSKIPYKFNIDDILKNTLSLNDNLELLSVKTFDKNNIVGTTINNIDYINYANKMNDTHLSEENNLKFFFYILDIICKSNAWDCVLLDLSGYSDYPSLQQKVDILLNVIPIDTLLKITFSEDKDLIGNFREKVMKDKDLYTGGLIINNLSKNSNDFMNLIDYIGIEKIRVVGSVLQKRLFNSNLNDMENIIHNLNLV